MLGTLVRKVKKDNSPEMIDACIDDVRDFFQNFEEIFRDDLKVIFG